MSEVAALLLLAGLSEAAGRLLPVVSGRSAAASRRLVIGLLLTGAVVEGAVFALWPLTAWTIAGLVNGAGAATVGLTWTPSLIAPLVLTAVLAFPLLGPMFHLSLLVGVGASLAGPLATGAGVSWGAAAACVALAGLALGLAVNGLRRLVATTMAAQVPEPRA